VKRNNMLIVNFWRDEFSKIKTIIHHTAKQELADSKDSQDINWLLSQKISHASVLEDGNPNDCENHVHQEIKCAACGSTNLIKISDQSKAMLFLGSMEENLEPVKVRSRRGKNRSNKLMTMWWCLDCKRLC